MLSWNRAIAAPFLSQIADEWVNHTWNAPVMSMESDHFADATAVDSDSVISPGDDEGSDM
jgi:hypothetical protein